MADSLPESCKCLIDGCLRPVTVRGYCNAHYLRLRRTGDPLGTMRKPPKGRGSGYGFVKCANEHCGRTAIIRIPDSADVVCNRHYLRAIGGGDWRAPDKPRAPGGVCTVPGCSKKVRSGHAFKCDTHYYRELRGSDLGDGPIHPPCRRCGGPTAGNQSRFCSERCQGEHRRSILENRLKHADGAHRIRAKKLGVHFEPKVDLMAVVERDGWTCYICGEAIPPGAKRPDRLSLSIDHQHALANGGGHTFANCRASHLGCNFEKAWTHDNKLSAKGRRVRKDSAKHAAIMRMKGVETPAAIRREKLKQKLAKGRAAIPSRPFAPKPQQELIETHMSKSPATMGWGKRPLSNPRLKRTMSGKVVPR